MRSLCIFLSSGLAFAASAPTFPVLTYSTYLRDSFTPKAIATDAAGNIYMAGTAVVDAGTSQTAALVVKLNPQTGQYLYVHYLAGSRYDQANAIAVDTAGNAYVAGGTNSPDFPVTPGGSLGTPPAAPQFSARSFVTKLDPNGEVLFSDFLGGSAASSGEAVAITPAGQVLVSGAVYINVTGGTGPQFPGTPGAYKTPGTVGAYLLELDPSGAKMVFSALGIGGSAIALDSTGNIYVAGSTTALDYPTTPGAYQTKFPSVVDCGSPDCAFPTAGANQYVTKVDPTGSTLIYSTAVTGARGAGNGGLAVDQAGNVYVTGFAGAGYPYTVPVPPLAVEQAPASQALPFLSKLDPAGQTLLFSIPVGGAGVQLDSAGGAYVGGVVGTINTVVGIPSGIPALAGVPSQCLPSSGPSAVGPVAAYAAEVDASSGNLLGSKFIGGSTLSLSNAALLGSTLWIAGSASLPNFPFTPNALTLTAFGPASLAGAYLGAVDFSQPQPPAGTPQIGCVVDAADLAMAGPVARSQLLTIFGTGLGPATAVTAADTSTTMLGGAGVNFAPIQASVFPPGPLSAPLLYASSTQINLAVPQLSFSVGFAAMQLTVNGLAATPIQVPVEVANPSLFPVVLNADGSVNSATHAAPLGSTVSMFVNGLSGLDPEFPWESNIPLQLSTSIGWSVTNIVGATPFVLRVDLQVPSSLPPKLTYCTPGPGQTFCIAPLQVSISYSNTESGFMPNTSGQGAEETVYMVVPE